MCVKMNFKAVKEGKLQMIDAKAFHSAAGSVGAELEAPRHATRLAGNQPMPLNQIILLPSSW